VIIALVYLQSKRQAPSMKVANSAIPWLTFTVLRWTTDLQRKCISTETEGRSSRSPLESGEGATTWRWNDKPLAYSIAGTFQRMRGKLRATRKTAPIQVPKSRR
jgi:hypothetical protein